MPKEIYVYKQLIGSWKGISKEEAEIKIKGGSVIGVEFTAERGDGDTVKIVLLYSATVFANFVSNVVIVLSVR